MQKYKYSTSYCLNNDNKIYKFVLIKILGFNKISTSYRPKQIIFILIGTEVLKIFFKFIPITNQSLHYVKQEIDDAK